MQFKQWLENLTGPNSLPPIPGGFTRLTHFTSDRAANAVLQGQNFDYKKQVILSSTTDPHATNQEVWDTITSGMAGAFTRHVFGQAVILIDISSNEYRMHGGLVSSPKYVENRKIVGVVYRQNMDFRPNPNYNPQGDQKPQIQQMRQMPQATQAPQMPQAVQAPQATQLPDVW